MRPTYLLIINGPNLNLQGRREPEIYGHCTFEDLISGLRTLIAGCEVRYRQSNCEGELIGMLHEAGFDPDCIGIILNPGAYAHYSYAMADAVRAIPAPVIEVHISNVWSREDFRHRSVVAPAASGSICGLGLEGYRLAAECLIRRRRPAPGK